MDMPDIPETLVDLTDDDLSALGEALQAAGAEAHAMTEDESTSAEDRAAAADAVIAAADAFQAVLNEQARREQDRQEQEARIADALAILGGPAAEGDEGDAADEVTGETAAAAVEASTAPEAPAPEAPAATAAPESAAVEPSVPSEPAQPQEASVHNDTPDNGDLDLSDVADPTAALAVATGQTAAVSAAPIRVPAVPSRSRYRRREPIPKTLSRFTDLGAVDATARGEEVDKRQLATIIANKYDQVKKMGKLPPITLATATAEHDVNLTRDPVANTEILRGQQAEMQALVASGGNCAIPMNNYDVFNAAQPIGPIGGFVRTVGAEARGAMRFLSAPSWTAAQAGISVVTNDEDADGYTNQDPPGTTEPKVCVHFDCPEEVTCIVDAVAACASFGNLTYRTAPELVEVLLDQLATAQEQAKEISYLDALAAGSTGVTDDANPYGAVRSSVWTLANALFAYRKRNHIPHTVPLDVLAPDTMIPVLKADAVADLHLGMEFLGVDQETLAAELFQALNANVAFYYDHTTADGTAQSMQNAQAAGSLGNFPLTFKVYFYAPGTWVRLDGGRLDIGLTRDSTLNSQNDLQIWSEEFTVLCMVGSESVELELELCPSGAGPEPVTALTCAS